MAYGREERKKKRRENDRFGGVCVDTWMYVVYDFGVDTQNENPIQAQENKKYIKNVRSSKCGTVRLV